MNRNLLPPISSLFASFKTKSYILVLTLVLVLNFGITSKINAQCIGPYQVFESFGAAATRPTMITNGWAFSAAAVTPASSAAASRSGSNFLNMGATLGANVTTPIIVNPNIFQFYHRSTLTTRDVVIKVEWLTSDLSTVLGFASATTTSTAYSAYTVNLSAFTNIRVRITYDAVSGASGAPGLQLDDISWTSTIASQNTIVVPERGNSTCSSVTVPAAGSGVLKFYDQGGLSDNYSSPRTYQSAATATSVGTTVTVGTTTNLVVGMFLTVQAGTGAFSPGTTVTNIIDATSFTVSVAPTTPLIAATVFGTLVTTPYVSSGASSAGTTITVATTANLVVGMSIAMVSGTGAFAAGTTVTSILNATSFTVSVAPTTALSGAVVRGTPPQTQIVVFQPTNASEKVRLTFVNLFALDALANITVYNGNGAIAGNEFANSNAYTNTSLLPGAAQSPVNSFTSTDPSGFITVKFVSSILTPLSGFDVNVECIADLSITSLSASSGCSGTPFTVTGTGFTNTAMSATVGGFAATATYVNGTTITITPTTAVASGAVVLTNGGTAISPTNYTVNALPTVSAGSSVCVGSTITISPVTGGTWSSSDATKATVTNSGIVTGISAGSATFTFTNSTTGCSATTSAVTINALPVVSAGSSVCVGSTITLSPTTGGTWSSSNNSIATITNAGIVTGVSSGSVNFSFNNSTTGCNAVTSSVNVIDAPVVILNTTLAQTYCLNATASALSVTASTVSGVITSYQWFSNIVSSTSGAISISGATSNSYPPLTTTSGTLYYFCQVTNTAGCVTNSAVSGGILINGPLSPTTTTAATGPSFSSFVANWTALVGATGYYLDVSTSNTFATFLPGYNNLLVGNVSSYLVSGLVINTPYYYRVRAINSCATSSDSNTTTITTGSISYCNPTYATGSATGDEITNVTLGALNNTSGASAGPAFYTFYNSVTIPTLYQNSTSTISISFGTQSRQYVGVWIDYNQNSLFEVSEGVVSVNNAGSNGTSVLTIVIPAGAITGNTRMRVRGGDNAALTTAMACGASGSIFGETEDYIVNILPIPPCAVVLPTGLASSFVTGTSATISWSDASNTLGSIYEYAFSTSSATPTSGTLITSATSANLTGLTDGVTYYAWVRTNCGGSNQSAWVGPISFFTGVLDVVNLNATTNGGSLTTCFAKFYDSGGPTAPYTNNESYTYTFVPATAGSKLKAVFNSFALENNYDFLSIYNGTTATAANLVGTYTNAQIAAGQTFFSTAPGGELTFRFTSDISVTPAGWDVSLSCVTVPTISSFTPTSACAGVATVVTITGTNMSAVNSVSFNGITAVPTATTATSVTVNLPATATSGLVTVSTATASGNSALATVPVFTVNPRPSTPNAGADANICTGGPLTLNAAGVISPQPIYQNNFSSGAGLVTSHTNWSAVSTNLAGGAASGELRFNWTPSSTDDFWIYPNQLINTTGYTSLNLTFNSAVDWFSGTFNLYVDTSPDGVTWTPRWNVAPTGNIAAGPVSVNLGALDGTSFYIRYRLSGNSFNIDFWYIDDLIVTGIPTLNYSWNTNSSLSSTSIANPIATPTTTQTYTVTTSFNGCSSPSDSVLVTVSPKPTSVISGSQSVCNGATASLSVALTGVAPWSLTYTNGTTSTTVTGILTSPYTFTTPAISTTTTYTISALSDSRCSSGPADRTGSAVISLIIPPTVTIAASAASVCFNFASQTTTLAYSATSGSPATYSIIWGAGYLPSGFVTMTDAPFPAGASGTINVTVPPGADNSVLNTATIVVKNAQGCISASYSFSLAVNISPAVTMTVSSQTRCFSASSQTVTYNYSGANVANSYDVTWNASPANSLQTFSNIPFPSSSGSITINVPAGTPGGTYTGTVTPRNSGCGVGAAPRTITLIISQPSITPAASAASTCFSATAQTTTLAYSNPVATPTLYSIAWNSVPANSFVGVTDASITASPLTISIPANTAENTYTGTISVKNANGCVSPGTTFTVSVVNKPVMSGISIQSLCSSASIQYPLLTFSSVANSPTSYSIDWNPAANAAGLADQGVTTDAFASTGITTIVIPANLPLNQ
ncbi:MAG: beta strand repeat-containing protein, partial [Flavobacterium sp.]|uniref:beta strand repeat-containing protein n=1 Tax=Flavobacterium sp. TaxID=239 RepID=UPI003BC1D7E3